MKLSTKFLFISGFILIVFFIASFAILFHAQSLQATQEMDQLLKNEALALSALANTTKSGAIEFEMSPFFLSKFEQHNPNGFFRYIQPNTNKVLKESSNAPTIGCLESKSNTSVPVMRRIYRIETLIFRPEFDGDLKGTNALISLPLCLIVGIDEAPYKAMAMQTTTLSIPLLALVALLLIGTMLVLVRRLTHDLSTLTLSLATTDFEATHAFPALPSANTSEVKAVIEKLEGLHSQAANAYSEMWLFLSRAAHQIKTPITAMQTTLEVLLRKERSKEELLSGLDDVKIATAHLADLTRKLISSSRISYQETPTKEKINLKIFFLDLANLFRSKANESNITIDIENTDDLEFNSGRSLMSDLFGNLIENSILYSKKSTRVTIAWRVADENISFEISDQGPGFPPEVINGHFKPFIRGDEREISGSGLGLSIAKKSALLLGGEIELKDSSPRGSKIRVTLPLI